MDSDRRQLLPRAVRIAYRAGFESPQSCKGILRLLVHELKLKDAFLFFGPDPGATPRRIAASGDGLLRVARLPEDSPEREVMHRRLPIFSPDAIRVPVIFPRGGCGVLTLLLSSSSPSADELNHLLPPITEFLSGLMEESASGEEKHRRDILFSELGRVLNRALSMNGLLRATAGTLLRHGRATAVIIRPLYGETVLGRGFMRTDPAFRHLRPLFRELEDELSAQVARDGKVIHRREGGSDRKEKSTLSVLSLPVRFQDRAVGVLTLFASGGEKGGGLVLDRDSRRFYSEIGEQVAQAMQRVLSMERLEALSEENDRKLRETSLLYHVSRAMHGTLRLNELMHLILSAAALPTGGGFDRAFLFMLNERSGTLQGMLGVTRETAALVLPPQHGPLVWARTVIGEEVQEAQRNSLCCRRVLKQRLPLDPSTNALAKAVHQGEVIYVSDPAAQPSVGALLAEALELAPYACAPLFGRDRTLGVLLVDNPYSQEEFTADRRRFLELFASQAGQCVENSMLLHRLETAHQDLRETQERLIQGEKMAVLGEMAASIAHELRSPLVPIGGFAQRLSRITVPGSRENEYASIIAREARRMEDMLTNILSFSKQQVLSFSECRMAELIQEALSLEGELLGRAAIRLVTEIEGNLPVIQADEQKLRQVLVNLIANARQVMTDGGTLVVRAYSTSLRGDEAVAVEVEDTGGGISPEIMRNIFNPFFTTKEKGTGLGLSISHRIVEQHQGEIEVRNREQGVVFILRLPVQWSGGGSKNLSVDKTGHFS